MSIEVGDLVRYNNKYLKIFQRHSKRARKYFRRKNTVMRVLKIHFEYCLWRPEAKRMIHEQMVDVDVPSPLSTIYQKDQEEGIQVISTKWLAVVKKVKKGASGLPLRGVNLSARQVASSGAAGTR